MLFRFKRSVLALVLSASSAHAFDIIFDYSMDTGNFFSGANVDRRLTLEAAAAVFEQELSTSSISPIVPTGTNTWSLLLDNPTTGNPISLSNPTLAANTLTIYIGARDLAGTTVGLASNPGFSVGGTQAWLDGFSAKNSASHFEPLGGSISFDTATDWYFDPNPLTLESFPNQIDFFSVAQHEIGHLLGFTDQSLAFEHFTIGGAFTGPNATRLFGGPIPLSSDLSHWKSSVTFQNKPLTMTPALTANVRTHFSSLEFAVLRDIGFAVPTMRFYGTFENGGTRQTDGTWRFSINRLGSITGVLILNGRRIVLRGTLDAAGHWEKLFASGADAATILFDQDPATMAISGSLTVNGISAQFSGNQLPNFNTANKCPLLGSYTVAFTPENPAPNPLPPQGAGYARLVIGTTGTGTLTGKLADGTPFLLAAPLSDTNALAFSSLLARNLESLHGTLGYAQSPANDFEGPLLWSRRPNTGSIPRPWNDGFTTTISGIGSVWTKPLTGFRVLGQLDSKAGAGKVDLTLNNATLSTSILVSTSNLIIENPITSNLLRMQVNTTTGVFSGSYLDTIPSPNVRRNFAGVFLQKQNRADGYFLKLLAPRESGRIALTVP